MKRVLLAAALILAGSTVVASPAAATPANSLPPGYFLVCGRGTTTGSGTCMSLQQAINAATPIPGTVTIEMLPGEYCPPTLPTLGGLHGVYWSDLKFVGVGLAAYDADGPPTSLNGPEAEMTSFKWDDTCGTEPNALFTLENPGPNASVDFRNLSFVGTAGGPTYGLHDVGVNVGMRDVMFDGLNTGLYWDGTGTSITDSAFVNNTYGVDFEGGSGSIVNSTLADNHYGFTGSNFSVNLLGDSLTHNSVAGYSSANSGNTVQAVNTLNAGNAANCSGTGWEALYSEHNLLGSDCTHTADGDLVADGTTISDAALNGGPTTSVLPPSQAQGNADFHVCGFSTGGDQREYALASPATSCDIGAVQTSANGTPSVTGSPTSGSAIDFGTIPFGISRTQTASASRGGGDLLFVFAPGGKVSGAGFAITVDTCEYDVMPANSGSCVVGISATPPDDHSTFAGSLEIRTSGGTLTYPLTAKGGPPLKTPTAVHAQPGNKKVTLSWTEPSGGTPADHYQLRMSSDGGANWEGLDDATSSPVSVNRLQNGTRYEFEVAPVDSDFDSGDWSKPSNLARPHTGADASTLTRPDNATVDYDAAATVKGTLTDSDSSEPIAGAGVQLLSRRSNGSSFAKVGTGTTSDAGKVSVTVHHLKANADFEWKYAGNSTHHAVTSSAGTILVTQTVAAHLAKSSVKKGVTATVWGTVSPDETGRTVELQKQAGSGWTTKATVKIKKQKLPNGTTAKGFVFTITASPKGTMHLRVRRASTTANATGLSSTLALHVT